MNDFEKFEKIVNEVSFHSPLIRKQVNELFDLYIELDNKYDYLVDELEGDK